MKIKHLRLLLDFRPSRFDIFPGTRTFSFYDRFDNILFWVDGQKYLVSIYGHDILLKRENGSELGEE